MRGRERSHESCTDKVGKEEEGAVLQVSCSGT